MMTLGEKIENLVSFKKSNASSGEFVSETARIGTEGLPVTDFRVKVDGVTIDVARSVSADSWFWRIVSVVGEKTKVLELSDEWDLPYVESL